MKISLVGVSILLRNLPDLYSPVIEACSKRGQYRNDAIPVINPTCPHDLRGFLLCPVYAHLPLCHAR